MLKDENEMMIEYSEMTGFDFNSEAYREVKEVENAIQGVFAIFSKIWLAKTIQKGFFIMYNVMDLFAGVGGLSYGFSKLPEFNIVAANEIEKDIATAYSLNHPDVPMLNCDINNLTEEKISEVLGGKKVDIIVGGPPCQSYSTVGKRQMDDRANLFLQYKRILQIVQPTAFVFENVVGILSMDKGNLFKRVQEEFNSIGYDLKYKVLNAVDYGVPQQRERVILVGFKGSNPFERMYADSALTPATLFTESYTYIKGNWNVKSES